MSVITLSYDKRCVSNNAAKHLFAETNQQRADAFCIVEIYSVCI